MQFLTQHHTIKQALDFVESWLYEELETELYRPNNTLDTSESSRSFFRDLKTQVLREGLPHIKELGDIREVLFANLQLAEDRLACILSVYMRILGFCGIAAVCLYCELSSPPGVSTQAMPTIYLAGFVFLVGVMWIQTLFPQNVLLTAECDWDKGFVQSILQIFRIEDSDFCSQWLSSKAERTGSSPHNQLRLANRKLQKSVAKLKGQIFVWEWVGLGVPSALLIGPWVMRSLAIT
jgi:hypothetical protein